MSCSFVWCGPPLHFLILLTAIWSTQRKQIYLNMEQPQQRILHSWCRGEVAFPLWDTLSQSRCCFDVPSHFLSGRLYRFLPINLSRGKQALLHKTCATLLIPNCSPICYLRTLFLISEWCPSCLLIVIASDETQGMEGGIFSFVLPAISVVRAYPPYLPPSLALQ